MKARDIKDSPMKRIIWILLALCSSAWANPYYTASGFPVQGALMASAPFRAEFLSIQSGFTSITNNLITNAITATGTVSAGNFSGPGTSLTGTASALNIGGTAVNATNLTGSGTVSATATGGAGLSVASAVNATNVVGSGTVSATTLSISGSAIVPAAALSTQAVQAGQMMGKNKIINGDFKVNQKAFTSPLTLVAGVPSTGAGYGHDMWRGGASGCTYSFTNANLGLSSVATITAGSLITAVESVNIDATTYVLSWTGTAVARIGVNGAAPSGNFAASPIYVTTAVIGTQTSVEFAMSGSLGGSSIVNTGTGTLSLVQMEEGVYKTTFERKLYDQVLRECQRYLPYWNSQAMFGFGTALNGGTGVVLLPYFVPPRVYPTGLVASVTAANYTVSNASLIVGPCTSVPAIYTNFANATSLAVQFSWSPGSPGAGAGSPIWAYASNSSGFIYATGAQI